MIIKSKQSDYNQIVCFYIEKGESLVFVTETDFFSPLYCKIINDNTPSWWVKNKVGECIINGPEELVDFSNLFELVVEPEYYEMKDIIKLRELRENEAARQIKEIIISNFVTVDKYLDIVKRDKYELYIKDYINKGYEFIDFDDFRVDNYLAMQLENLEHYINKKNNS